jgi:hypothetical protein
VNYSWSMNLHGNKYGGPMLPDMMRWLWRDAPVSLDPNDMTERAFRGPYVPPAAATPAAAPTPAPNKN